MLCSDQTNNAFIPAMVFSTLLHGVIALLLSLGSKTQQVYSIGNQQVMHATMVNQTALQAVSQDPNRKQPAVVNALRQRLPAEHALSKRSSAKAVASALSKKQLTQIAQQPIEEKSEKRSAVVGTQQTAKLKAKQQTDAAAARSNILPRIVEKGQQAQKTPLNQQPSKIDKERLDQRLAGQKSNPAYSKNQGLKTQGSQEQGIPTAGEINDYAMRIKVAIERNLIKESRYQGQQCEVALRIAEDGLILQAEARKGGSAVCGAAIRAIGITGQVPKPPNTKLYQLFQDLVISFEL